MGAPASWCDWTACPPTPPLHALVSTCKHIPGGRTKKSDVREKRKQACSVEEDESFAPYQEATSTQNKSDLLISELNLQRETPPQGCQVGSFIRHNWATFEALPQAKLPVCWFGAKLFSMQIASLISGVKCNNFNEIHTQSARIHAHHHENHRLSHSTQQCTCFYMSTFQLLLPNWF